MPASASLQRTTSSDVMGRSVTAPNLRRPDEGSRQVELVEDGALDLAHVLAVGELPACRGADVERVEHLVPERRDLRDADVEIEIGERARHSVQHAEAVFAAD